MSKFSSYAAPFYLTTWTGDCLVMTLNDDTDNPHDEFLTFDDAS